MSIQGSKLVAPIVIQVVYSLLCVAKTGTYYDAATICSSERINKWSKHKPIRYNSPLELSDALFSGTNGLWGLNIPIYTSAGTLESGFLHDLFEGTDWDYLRTRPGTDWCRLTDFNGYNHAAICPFGTEMPTDIFLGTGDKLDVQLDQIEVDSDNLKLSDFEGGGISFSDYYAGLALKNGMRYLLVTSANKLTDSVNISVSDAAEYVGTWQAAIFLCSSRITPGGSIPKANYIPMPIPIQDIQIHEQGGEFVIRAFGVWNNLAHSSFTYYFEAYGAAGQGGTLTGIRITLMRKTASQDYPEGTVVASLKSGLTVQIPSGGTYSSPEYEYNVTTSSSYEYYLTAIADDVDATYMPIEENPDIEV